MLIAPAPGDETRRQLREKAEEMVERGKELGRGREQAGEIGQRAFDCAVGE
jgi:gas vesicle protein